METMQTIGQWMMVISMSLIAIAVVLAISDQRPKKDPNKR